MRFSFCVSAIFSFCYRLPHASIFLNFFEKIKTNGNFASLSPEMTLRCGWLRNRILSQPSFPYWNNSSETRFELKFTEYSISRVYFLGSSTRYISSIISSCIVIVRLVIKNSPKKLSKNEKKTTRLHFRHFVSPSTSLRNRVLVTLINNLKERISRFIKKSRH